MSDLIRNYPKFNEMYELCVAQKNYQGEVINKHILDARQDSDWLEIEISQEEMDTINAMSDVIQDLAQDIADDLEIEFDEVWKELRELNKEMQEAH